MEIDLPQVSHWTFPSVILSSVTYGYLFGGESIASHVSCMSIVIDYDLKFRFHVSFIGRGEVRNKQSALQSEQQCGQAPAEWSLCGCLRSW